MEKRRPLFKILIVAGVLAFFLLAALLAVSSGVIYDLFFFDGSKAMPETKLTLEDLIENEDGSYEVRLNVDFHSRRKLEGLAVSNIGIYTDPEEGKKKGKDVKWMYRARRISALPVGTIPKSFKLVFVTDVFECESPEFSLFFGIEGTSRLGGIFKGGTSFGVGQNIKLDRRKATKGLLR